MKKLLIFTLIFLSIILSSCGKNNPTQHTHTELILTSIEATCTTTGLTEGKKCSRCGEILIEQQVIPTLEHSFVNGKCSVCDTKDPSYQPEHIHIETVLAKIEATCTTTGLTEGKKCSECGEILVAQEEIAAKGHTEEVIPGREATCTKEGLTEGKKCPVCDEILIEQKNIPLLEHTFKEGICTMCDTADPNYQPNEPDQEIYYSVTLLDRDLNKITTIQVKENEYLSTNSFPINNIPDGYFWNKLVKYSHNLTDFEEADITTLQVTTNLYIIPVFSPNEYVITMQLEDGNRYDIIKTGEPLLLTTLEKEGYQFIGWFSNDVLVPNGTLYTPSLGTIFVPHFEKLTVEGSTYSITYQYEGKTKSVNYQLNDPIIEFTPEVTGYQFVGWYLNNQLFTDTTFKYEKNITLVAKFVPLEFKIIYTNIDTAYEETVKYEDYYSLYKPTRNGYTFSHWEYQGSKFNNGTWTYLNDITLTAVWVKNNTDEPTISLNLETLGGMVDSNAKVIDNIIQLPTPTLKGYVFKYWCTDSALTNQVTTLYANAYNNEKLYAYYEYDSDDLKGQAVVTMYNAHATNYDELAMFDSTQSGFTSKYWHKVGIKKNSDGYYVSAIATNGEVLSSLGSYDYVILAYSDYDYYSQFVNLGYSVGDMVYMITDPQTSSNGATTNIISFVKASLGNNGTAIKEYLSSVYGSYTTVTSNINLITSYNGFGLTWKTSNRETITSAGKYTKPYATRNVTLSAYVGDEKVYDFTVRVPGTVEKSTALATGYIYTPYSITQNAMNTLDIIYCAFLDIDDNGNWTNLSRFTSNINTYIKDKAKNAGTKIVVSVNQSNSTAFGNVASSATLREKLADNIVNVIQTLGLDGVDIDWETPTSSQATTFTLLMEAIYRKVKAANPEYLVTAAIGGGMWQPPKYDLTNSGKYLDYVNLMTYSMTTGNSYYQNSLYKSTKGATLVSCSIDESVDIFNNYNIPNNKILVGIPFYTTVQTGSGGPGSKVGSGKSVWYNQLFTTYALSDTMKEYFDEECGVPYRYDATKQIFISYDNEESIKCKCDYINALGLAGIMYWQYGQDVNDMLSNAIDKYINA